MNVHYNLLGFCSQKHCLSTSNWDGHFQQYEYCVPQNFADIFKGAHSIIFLSAAAWLLTADLRGRKVINCPRAAALISRPVVNSSPPEELCWPAADALTQIFSLDFPNSLFQMSRELSCGHVVVSSVNH